MVQFRTETTKTTKLPNSELTQFDVLNRFLDRVDLDLTAKAWSVMVALIHHSKKNNACNFSCFPAIARLSAMTRLSGSSVKRGLKELVSNDLITYYQRENNSNYYTILSGVDDLPVWFKTKEERTNIMILNKSKIKRNEEILLNADLSQADFEALTLEIKEIKRCGSTKRYKRNANFVGGMEV